MFAGEEIFGVVVDKSPPQPPADFAATHSQLRETVCPQIRRIEVSVVSVFRLWLVAVDFQRQQESRKTKQDRQRTWQDPTSSILFSLRGGGAAPLFLF